ncbi:hypothetical protein J6590_085180 [Homalodisca vitripennis]|nr:hypothetical protein J6590_085180 [Homalodisca vitripennis]
MNKKMKTKVSRLGPNILFLDLNVMGQFQNRYRGLYNGAYIFYKSTVCVYNCGPGLVSGVKTSL